MPKAPSIPLPRDWSRHVKSGFLHALALARALLITARSGFENIPLERARLIAKADHLAQENALLKEELRIKDARLARVDPAKRPHYPGIERLAILALRAATGWNTADTARRFFLAPATIAAWMRRLDEDGPEALVQTPEPINRFPDAVALLLQKLKLHDALARSAKARRCSRARGVAPGAQHGRALDEAPATAATRRACSRAWARAVHREAAS